MVKCTSCCPMAGLAGPNKIVPVTSVPSSCDYLEIRPNRRIRVIHRLPEPQAVIQKLRKRSDSDDDEYWFENAAPKRLPIKPDPPPQSISTASRIINKFEPQQPPKIPGIKPPRASLNGGDKAKGDRHKGSPRHRVSPGQRLPRKKLNISAAIDEDDDDRCVDENPCDDTYASGDDDFEEEGHEGRKDSVVGDNFVASVLADMSGMVLSIAADATSPGPNTAHVPTGEIRSSSHGQHPSREDNVSSPTPDDSRVETQPDPEEDGRNDEVNESQTVEGSAHLGGLANVAFEGEDTNCGSQVVAQSIKNNESHIHSSDQESLTRSINESDSIGSGDNSDSIDVGYARHRNLSDLAVQSKSHNGRIELSGSSAGNQTSSVCEAPNGFLPPVIFFLHGVGGCAETWSSQIDYFSARGFEIVVPDMLGHGFSSVPDNPKYYAFSKLLGDFLTIFDHYVAHSRQCIVIGHSYGCAFAAALSRWRPDTVSMLLLIACGGPTPLSPPPELRKHGQSKSWQALSRWISSAMRRQEGHSPKGKSMGYLRSFDLPSFVVKNIMAGQDWPEGDANFYRRIGIPTLLIYGLRDPIVSLVEMCEMERTIPRSYLELIPLAGHMVMIEKANELNVMMGKFIEKYLFDWASDK